MAVPDAVRRSGSLLLRTLAVGGLATAAWLVSAGAASAEDHPADAADLSFPTSPHAASPSYADATTGPDLLPIAGASPASDLLSSPDLLPPSDLSSPSGLLLPPNLLPSSDLLSSTGAVFDGQQAQAAGLLSAAVPARESAVIFEIPQLAFGPRPVAETAAVNQALANEVFFADEAFTGEDLPYPEDLSYPDGYSHSGHSHSGHSHSGSATNAMPAPMYEAKVAARAAAAATPAPPAPAPPPTPAPAPESDQAVEAITSLIPTAPDTRTTGNPEVTWEAPEQNVPAPAPKQAPAPSAPTASSTSADNGGGHRGGPVASLTGQSDVERTTTWSVERRDDGRSPGSVPGLPSTSPD
ncbi:hypothetical protein [Saccharothrix xinjiangensis]|uniref:Uncharacterized protein n=1 Tax=Saccharothrix xinjiangensis TaxID=204798 RepID=A0ABV9Y8U3_9PSEU